MAVYKVPQDVEAEDKLLGPLTFRQFVYLIIATASAGMMFFMFQVFWPLALIPVPFLLLFGILALPLRKDQPMETYLLALLRFYLKSKQRLWDPDGTITYVEITAPRNTEQHLAKSYGSEAAKQRLDYLARVMDSRGWALKGMENTSASLATTVVAEASTAVDVLDEDAELSRSLEMLIAKKDQERRDAAIAQMQHAAAAPKTTKTTNDDVSIKGIHYNPYPSSMHQKVVQPLSATTPKKEVKKTTKTPTTPAATNMTPAVSPDIIRLANNDDLSISALAHEAHRIEEKDDDEVVIKLH